MYRTYSNNLQLYLSELKFDVALEAAIVGCARVLCQHCSGTTNNDKAHYSINRMLHVTCMAAAAVTVSMASVWLLLLSESVTINRMLHFAASV